MLFSHRLNYKPHNCKMGSSVMGSSVCGPSMISRRWCGTYQDGYVLSFQKPRFLLCVLYALCCSSLLHLEQPAEECVDPLQVLNLTVCVIPHNSTN